MSQQPPDQPSLPSPPDQSLSPEDNAQQVPPKRQRKRFLTRRNLVIIGVILVLIVGFLFYHQATVVAGPPSSWVGTLNMPNDHRVDYLSWVNHNNQLHGSGESVEYDESYGGSFQTWRFQITGISSQNQTLSLYFSFKDDTERFTGKINGNTLTLYDTHNQAIESFHAGSRDEYQHNVQQNAVTATVQAKATQTQAQATVTATTQTYTQTLKTTPIVNDSLADNTDGRWVTLSQAGKVTSCQSRNNALDVSSLQLSSNGECFNDPTIPRNFLLQVQVTIVKGNTVSIRFRTEKDEPKYSVEISLNGDYAVTQGETTNSGDTTLFQGKSSAIAQGLSQNRFGTVAILYQNNILSLYFNDASVNSTSNISMSTTLPPTSIVDLDVSSEALFRQLKIWSLSSDS